MTRKKPAPPPPVPVPDYDLPPCEMESTDGVALRKSTDRSGVRVSIGTYHEVRPEPTKLDFLPPKRHSTSPAGTKSSDGAIKNQLQTELNATLSRARLRQRLPSSDLPLKDDKETKGQQPAAEVVVVSKEITNVRPTQAPPAPPVLSLSTFRRTPSLEIQAKMATLAAAGSPAIPVGATISQSADNKVTIKVHPYVSRSDFGQT